MASGKKKFFTIENYLLLIILFKTLDSTCFALSSHFGRNFFYCRELLVSEIFFGIILGFHCGLILSGLFWVKKNILCYRELLVSVAKEFLPWYWGSSSSFIYSLEQKLFLKVL